MTASRHAGAAVAAIEGALRAVDPESAVRRSTRVAQGRLSIGDVEYDLSDIRKIALVGAGKAVWPMAWEMAGLLGDRVDEGLALVHRGGMGASSLMDRIRFIEAGHPVPDAEGIRGAGEILRLAESLGEPDLLIALIAGGASALLTLPAGGLTLEDLQCTTDLLLRSGADIKALNTVRKHLSRIKGGQLAKAAFPAGVASLILSDVVGNDLAAIGSGPTAPDPTTFADALRVLDHQGLRHRVPQAVWDHLTSGSEGLVDETLKPEDVIFDKVHNLVIGSNQHAIEGAAAALDAWGITTIVAPNPLEGEAREVGRQLARRAQSFTARKRAGVPPSCLVFGGETTVTVRGKGQGGRNQELALAAAMALDGEPDVLVVTLATDGRDGPTDAAGAVATGHTLREARALGLDADHLLDDNNSYHFFKSLDDLLVTGTTRTNVADLSLIFIG